MIDLSQWRITVGLWGSSRHHKRVELYTSKDKRAERVWSLGHTIIAMAIINLNILLLCGDIEPNPGPDTDSKYCIYILIYGYYLVYFISKKSFKRCV